MNQITNTVSGLSLIELSILLVWVMAWKGWALWKSARRDEKWWFIALLIVNTFGLLEIFYIFVIARNEKEEEMIEGETEENIAL
jgi:hypothetical protein